MVNKFTSIVRIAQDTKAKTWNTN